MKKILLVSIGLFALHTCLAGIYRHDRKESEHAALAAQPQFACVGQLWYENRRSSERHGTCVLIGSKYVLTATHCVTDALYRIDTVNYKGTQAIVNQPYAEFVTDVTNYVCVFNGKKYRGNTIHLYPAYVSCDSKGKCDIALIELETPVTGIQPATICRSFNELGDKIVGVGFGVHGVADQPENIRETTVKLAGENTIDSLCGYKVNGQYVSMLCDFDHPTQTEHNSMGSTTPLPLEYTVGGGDSGGGAFRKTNRGWELVGICGGAEHGGVDISLLTTPGIGYYHQVMEWQRVSAFASWIDGIVK